MHVGSQVGPSDLLLNPRCMLDPIITVAGIHVVAHRGPLHCATDTTDSQRKNKRPHPREPRCACYPYVYGQAPSIGCYPPWSPPRAIAFGRTNTTRILRPRLELRVECNWVMALALSDYRWAIALALGPSTRSVNLAVSVPKKIHHWLLLSRPSKGPGARCFNPVLHLRTLIPLDGRCQGFLCLPRGTLGSARQT